MSKIFHPLMYLLACATRQELARQVQFLKTENEILRARLPKKIVATPETRSVLAAATRTIIRTPQPRMVARLRNVPARRNHNPNSVVNQRLPVGMIFKIRGSQS